MLKHVSVRSSEPHVRSQPALRSLQPGFQKDVNSLLEHKELPFPTFQLVKPTAQSVLENQVFYGWMRPSHLRPSFLLLDCAFPPVLVDSRDQSRKHTIRIPLARKKLALVGPIICEVFWDPQDQILWIFDVLWYKNEYVYKTDKFSERSKHLITIVNELLNDTSGYSDCSVRIPKYLSLEEVEMADPGFCIEFQPEASDRRRFVFLGNIKKMISNPKEVIVSKGHTYGLVDDAITNSSPSPRLMKSKIEEKPKPDSSKQIMKITKDKNSKLPDTYRLESTDNSTNMGLAAIRNMTISFALKEVFRTQTETLVEVKWYEPFEKYEILGLAE